MNSERRELPPENRLWDTEDVSYYLNCNPMTVNRMVWRGELRLAGRIGRHYRFLKRDVDAVLKKSRKSK